ncbi:hypothetical protein HYT32_00630 [Candidatus Roizmanbacteria bacterium]|nr:hypothetical protein [Candidatus Roizmanbacteria bacterium]
MNDDSILGGVVMQIGQTAKKAGQQAVKITEEVAKEAGRQVVGEKKERQPLEKNKNENYWRSDEERRKYLKSLYGSAEQNSLDSSEKSSNVAQNNNSSPSKNKAPSEFEKKIADKPPEEQKKLIEVRNRLNEQHKQIYFDPTFNPPKKQKEERPAEKVEKEKKEEMQELEQKEAKKPPPLAIVRERNKAEMFRGVSG